MPELPEVEVTRLGLLPSLPGRQIEKVTWSSKRLRTAMPRKLLLQFIEGNRIKTIDRRGKFLLFRMVDKSTLIIHLGMTGKLSLLPAGKTRAKHDHLCLQLDKGNELRFNDARRFGSVTVWAPDEAASREEVFSAGIGVEPLSETFQAEYLLKLGANKKQPVKNFLMDARKIAGIGNIYANEILFASGIHPLTPTYRISRPGWHKIAAATQKILQQAIECGGSSISDFLGTSGNPGYFQVQFKVYSRQGEHCRHCTKPIQKTVVGGRATYFCPCCQSEKI